MSAVPVPVSLTEHEMMVAALCGIIRNIAAIVDKRTNAHGLCTDADGWQIQIEGACGEFGVAKVLGVCWEPSVNAFGQPDLLGWIEVKSASDGCLIVRRNTDPEHAFVLITGRAPSYVVEGYILGRDARRDEWWSNRGNRPAAWFVPKAALSDIAELIGMCGR